MDAYAKLLRQPLVARLLGVALLGRLPISINAIAVLLLIREATGSFAVAGLTVGAMTLGNATGSPLQGRMVDRRGVGFLLGTATVHATMLAVLWMLSAGGAGSLALAGAALLAGAAFPPTGSVVRSMWPSVLEDRDAIPTAYAIDSVVFELGFVTGPLLTAGLLLTTGPPGGLAASALCVVAATTLLMQVAPAESRRAAGGSRPSPGPLASPGMPIVVLATIPVGFLIGTLEVVLPAFGSLRGSDALGSLLLAAWSGASGAAGFVYGARARGRNLVAEHTAVAFLLPLACLPLALADSTLAALALAALAGVPLAPVIATRNELIARLAPPGAITEAFGWVLTALIVGISTGALAAGALVEGAGWSPAVLAGPAFAALSACLLLAMQQSLRVADERAA